MSDWTRNDALWDTARGSLFPPSSFAAASAEVASVLRMVGADDALDVLDLPCGPGRHAIVLATSGHRVVGVDRTPSYLAEARTRAAERAERLGRDLSLELVEADMREFVRPGSFDLVLNLFTSFGFFDDIEDDRRVLRNVHRSLRPGGHLVIDVLGREILAGKFQAKDFVRLEDGRVMLQERRIVDDWGAVDVRWTYIQDGVEDVFDSRLRLYGAVDLKRELADAGFASTTVYGGFDGRPYDPDALRLIAVATA